jgi:hypothetical protein
VAPVPASTKLDRPPRVMVGVRLLMKLRRFLPGASSLLVATLAWSNPLPAESTTPDHDPNGDTIAETEIITKTGVAVGCTKVDIPFSGRVVSRVRLFKKRAIPEAQFAVVSHDPTVSVEVSVATDGAFSGSVGVWDEIYYIKSWTGRTRQDHRAGHAYLEIEAVGCESKIIRVDRRWRPRDLVLKCRDQ